MDQTLALCADVKTPFSYPWFTANIPQPRRRPLFSELKQEMKQTNNREKRRKKTTKAMRDKASDMKT
jgi:hypothetical protein